MGVLDKLDTATPARRDVTLILNQALNAEHDALRRSLEQAADRDLKGHGSMEESETSRVVKQMEAKRAAIEASQVTFVMNALDWRRRLALQAEHPPREGNQMDRGAHYNVDTYTPAIIRESCSYVVDNEGDEAQVPDPTWDDLLGVSEAEATKARPAKSPKLAYSQVNLLFSAASGASDQATRVPTSALFLLDSQDSGESSTSPSPGPDPAPSDSTAGSRPTSRKSTATKKAASSG
jgi:hypothetical protein